MNVNSRQAKKNQKKKELVTKAEEPIGLTESNSFDLSTLSLEALALRYREIDRQSRFLKGQILLEARKQCLNNNNKFGEWRSLNFNGQLTAQVATHLMNLAEFFNNERPLGDIPVSAGYLMAAPKQKDISEVLYERVSKMEKPSLKDVKEIIDELNPTEDVNKEVSNEDIEDSLNKLSKKKLVEWMMKNMNSKQLNKVIKG